MDGWVKTKIFWIIWYVVVAGFLLFAGEKEGDVGKKIAWLAFLVFISALWIVAMLTLPSGSR